MLLMVLWKKFSLPRSTGSLFSQSRWCSPAPLTGRDSAGVARLLIPTLKPGCRIAQAMTSGVGGEARSRPRAW